MALNYVRNAFQRGNTFNLDVMPTSKLSLSIIDRGLVHVGLFIFNTYFLCIISFILSLLLVSEIPMFSLKFKHFKWKGNEIRFVFLTLSVLMLATLQFVGVPLIIIVYVLLSVLTNILAKRKAVAE